MLSELESGLDLSYLKNWIDHHREYAPSKHGKNNLYKLFVCRALQLLREDGYFGFITPMPILGDEQALGIRKELINRGNFTCIEAFPQKDNPKRRVFAEAKLATTVFCYTKTTQKNSRFVSRVHPAAWIENDSPRLSLSAEEIPRYDPENLTIVSCSQADWDLATRIMNTGRLVRLSTVCTSFQGEVNETTDGKKGVISKDSVDGPLILRGANVCLYVIREASQGEALYLREEEFLAGKSPTSKASHGLQERVGFQRSSPQNNFRRIIAAYIPAHQFCFDTISYIPAFSSSVPLPLLLALLNSKLLEWYFRLGSTNSKVNEYQFNNLPCPSLSANRTYDESTWKKIRQSLDARSLNTAVEILEPELQSPPFSGLVAHSFTYAAERIIALEQHRGTISRSQRSSLAETCDIYQAFIDRILFRIAGVSEAESAGLEQRLATML